ncbi:MAG: DUF5665 domain-containing protein [Tepidibacter sp.]|uniref:DUF5665 domain-containing protein n=1 Tax=Tepidibacter sp. TaxID=2529387 RepID=UPI0025DCC36D|nr:DUF5665 domain-containing protein [Tepidibacter sp.]MCT4508502.1 DUF5665 domain-containing protein [Tepidibacter sp.]
MREDKIDRIEKKIDTLAQSIDKSRIREYSEIVSNPKRLIYLNFVAGLAKGFGTAIGLTILAAIGIYVLHSWVNLPLIGQYIAKLLDIIENYR